MPANRSRHVYCCAAAALFLSVSGGVAAAQGRDTLTLEHMRRAAPISWFGVSPDGEHVAYLLRREQDGGSDLWLVGTAGTNARRLTSDRVIRSVVGWTPSSQQLGFIAEHEGQPAFRTLTLDGTERSRCALPADAFGVTWIGEGAAISYAAGTGGAASAPRGPEPVLSSARPAGQAVFTCALETGAATRVTRESYHGLEFAWSPAGDALLLSAQREPGFYGALESDMYRVDLTSGAATPIVTRPGVDRSPLWSPDGRRVAFVSGFGRAGLLPNLGVAVLDVTTRDVRDVGQTHDRGGFFEGPYLHSWAPDAASIYYSVTDGLHTPLFSITMAGAVRRLSDAWQESHATYSYSLSSDARTIAFKRSATDMPADLFVAGAATGAARRLTSASRSLRELGVPRSEVVRWTSPDGLALEGLLLRPIEAGRGPWPLVTILHGGPASSYVEGFPGLSFYNPYQDLMLAARGFAVFLPNPRGSGGYGQAFRNAVKNDWGHGPTRDVLSGIDHVVQLGVADPQRLALLGWSYGGYLTTWMLAHSDRFVVASAGAGVYDLASHFGQAAAQIQEYFDGPPWRRADVYRAQSPVSHVERIKTPTLLFHGDADRAVSPAQTELLMAALRAAGATVESVVYPGAGHSIYRPEFQQDSWDRLLTWLRRWLPPTD